MNAFDGTEEPQFIEEEYYIEEEVEEEGEEERTAFEESQHGVETIKEVSEEHENHSPGDSDPHMVQAMGSIMQTTSLSGDKRRADSHHLTRSQRKITGSDFKEFAPNASINSSNYTDSNMASLVFKPRDSDAANFGGAAI